MPFKTPTQADRVIMFIIFIILIMRIMVIINDYAYYSAYAYYGNYAYHNYGIYIKRIAQLEQFLFSEAAIFFGEAAIIRLSF